MTKKKQPSFVAITDTHLSEYNIHLIESIMDQTIQVALENGLKYIYHVGDFFTERKSQPYSTLKCLIRIEKRLEKVGLVLRIIPGNHDKTDYESEDSFLDLYDKYKHIEVITTYDYFETSDGIRIHMIPYFNEKTTYSKYLKRVELSNNLSNVLLTHIAVNSVQNNDGSKVENDLTSEKFDQFDLVLIGHYHNYQEIDNIVYFGSTHQHNFGEDCDKGYTLIYPDLTFQQFQFEQVPKYNTTIIDLEGISKASLKKKLDQIEQSSFFEKIKFKGSVEAITSIQKTFAALKASGIKVEKQIDDTTILEKEQEEQQLLHFTGFTSETILQEFDIFSQNKEIEDKQSESWKNRLKSILIK